MPLRFIAAVDRLKQAGEQLSIGRITPVQHAALREAALLRALKEMAASCGIELVQPLGIDGKGDISMVAKPSCDALSRSATGQFGQAFADLLNGYSPRVGQRADATLSPESGKCLMSHLNVEKMILELAEKLAATKP